MSREQDVLYFFERSELYQQFLGTTTCFLSTIYITAQTSRMIYASTLVLGTASCDQMDFIGRRTKTLNLDVGCSISSKAFGRHLNLKFSLPNFHVQLYHRRMVGALTAF